MLSHRTMKLERAVLRFREPRRMNLEVGRHLPLWQRLVRNRRMIYVSVVPMPHRKFIGRT